MLSVHSQKPYVGWEHFKQSIVELVDIVKDIKGESTLDREYKPWDSEVLEEAHALAEKYGIAAMDAIHVAYAIHAKVDELVTLKKTPNRCSG